MERDTFYPSATSQSRLLAPIVLTLLLTAVFTVPRAASEELRNKTSNSVNDFAAPALSAPISYSGAIRVVDGSHFPSTMAGIQAALSDLPKSGGRVIVPGGDYHGVAPITIGPNQALSGVGRGSCRLIADRGFSGVAMVMNADTSGGQQWCGIEGIELDGNRDGGASIVRGLYLKSVGQPSFVRDVFVHACSGYGMVFAGGKTNGDAVWVENCNSARNGLGNIWVKDYTGAISLHGIHVQEVGSGKAGISIDGPTGGIYPYGIWLSDVAVEELAAGAAGVRINNAQGVHINGIQYAGSGSLGDLVKITGAQTTCRGIAIENIIASPGSCENLINDTVRGRTYSLTAFPNLTFYSTDRIEAGVVVGDSARFDGGIRVGGQAVRRILRSTAVLDFDLSATTYQDMVINVPGAGEGDEVALGVPSGSVTPNTVFYAWVSGANTVTIRALRTAGTPNPARGNFRVTVIH